MKDKMEEMQAYLSLQKEIGKTSKLKSLKRSTATIIPQKKGIGNMFKTDYYIDHLIGKFSITYVDKRKFFNYVKSLFFNERYEWSIKKYKVFITDNNIDSQNICTVLVELSNSDYVLEGKKMKGFLAGATKRKSPTARRRLSAFARKNDFPRKWPCSIFGSCTRSTSVRQEARPRPVKQTWARRCTKKWRR